MTNLTNEQIIQYLDSLESSETIKASALKFVETVRSVFKAEIDFFFVEQADEGVSDLNAIFSAAAVSGSSFYEVRFDEDPMKISITEVPKSEAVTIKPFDLLLNERFGETDVIEIECYRENSIIMRYSAVGKNCGKILEFYRTYLEPNIRWRS